MEIQVQKLMVLVLFSQNIAIHYADRIVGFVYTVEFFYLYVRPAPV